MNKNCIIRLETEADYREAENLTREAFWNVYRPGCLEHYVLHRFREREDFVRELDFVLEKEGAIIGHIMYARAEIELDGGGALPVMTFGPFSIAPEHKGLGLGTLLLEHSMKEAGRLGAGALAITGDIGFYGRLGFVQGSEKGIRYFADPNAPYFLVKELKEGFLEGKGGVYRDPEGYFADEKEAAAFDKLFPPKEKLKLPGQLV
ncbi:MAG: N-acetyltransferase [Oscillospiraceae bacterium]|nr:N-acetyltransferase [Oscillospiraceae bacterium]